MVLFNSTFLPGAIRITEEHIGKPSGRVFQGHLNCFRVREFSAIICEDHFKETGEFIVAKSILQRKEYLTDILGFFVWQQEYEHQLGLSEEHGKEALATLATASANDSVHLNDRGIRMQIHVLLKVPIKTAILNPYADLGTGLVILLLDPVAYLALQINVFDVQQSHIYVPVESGL